MPRKKAENLSLGCFVMMLTTPPLALRLPLDASCAPVWALIDSGTEVRFSARRCAVTTMSPMPVSLAGAGVAAALSFAGAGGASWALAAAAKAKALVAKSNAEQVLV